MNALLIEPVKQQLRTLHFGQWFCWSDGALSVVIEAGSGLHPPDEGHILTFSPGDCSAMYANGSIEVFPVPATSVRFTP